ncbi:MAG TPA: KamA family radical SAM protein, partial [Limnochordia bacterium]|nr:KamA family radical SAM protein [Limnochordia bacterium]
MSILEQNWHDWRWQFANRLRTEADFASLMELTDSEKQALSDPSFAVGVTPYFASLINVRNPACPIRRQAIPLGAESIPDIHDMADPLAEDEMSPVNNLVHRYPDRVLLIVTETCHVYCRHCTRRRRVGFEEKPISRADLANAVDYIRQNSNIRDVLISGGDPFTLGDQALEEIIKAVRAVPHVEVIRIGTRAPVTNPFRITVNLVQMLRKYHPLWINVQFNHPAEITPEASKACAMLADAGIPLGNQTVLLRGI